MLLTVQLSKTQHFIHNRTLCVGAESPLRSDPWITPLSHRHSSPRSVFWQWWGTGDSLGRFTYYFPLGHSTSDHMITDLDPFFLISFTVKPQTPLSAEWPCLLKDRTLKQHRQPCKLCNRNKLNRQTAKQGMEILFVYTIWKEVLQGTFIDNENCI